MTLLGLQRACKLQHSNRRLVERSVGEEKRAAGRARLPTSGGSSEAREEILAAGGAVAAALHFALQESTEHQLRNHQPLHQRRAGSAQRHAGRRELAGSSGACICCRLARAAAVRSDVNSARCSPRSRQDALVQAHQGQHGGGDVLRSTTCRGATCCSPPTCPPHGRVEEHADLF